MIFAEGMLTLRAAAAEEFKSKAAAPKVELSINPSAFDDLGDLIDLWGGEKEKKEVVPEEKTLKEVELGTLPSDFSFSAYLSPRGHPDNFIITHGGAVLKDVELIALALNDVCRTVNKGAFYIMPGRDKHKLHACDMVFTAEIWTEKGNRIWDKATCVKRLECLQAKKALCPSEKIIPLCVRLFDYHMSKRRSSSMSACSGGSLLSVSSDVPDLMSDVSETESDDSQACPYSTATDPALRRNSNDYSRRIEDISAYLLSFKSPTSTPFLCLTEAFEHSVNTVRKPTTNELAETFEKRQSETHDTIVLSDRASEAAHELFVTGGKGSHYEVIRDLLDAFEQDKTVNRSEDQRLFGNVTMLWQEVVNRMEDLRLYDGGAKSFWQ